MSRKHTEKVTGLRYFDHQFLRVEDFAQEQTYHMDRLRQHNALLHSEGIIDGLVLGKTAEGKAITITAGAALDSKLREVVLTEERGLPAVTPAEIVASWVKESEEWKLILPLLFDQLQPGTLYVFLAWIWNEEEPSLDPWLEKQKTRWVEKAAIRISSQAGRVAPGEIELGSVKVEASGITAVSQQGVPRSGSYLAEGQVTSREIATGAVGADEIATGAVGSAEIADDAVKSQHIAAGAVGSTEIANDAVQSQHIATGAVGATEIADDAVQSQHIAAGAVGSTEIANEAVLNQHIAKGAVGPAKIADDAVQSQHIKEGAVGWQEIAANAIVTGHISKEAVTGVKIAPNAIGSGHIAEKAVLGKHIPEGEIRSWHIATESVQAQHLEADSVGSTHIQVGVVAEHHLEDKAVTGLKLAPAAVGSDHIMDKAVEGRHIAEKSIEKEHLNFELEAGLAPNSVKAEHITAGAILPAHLTDSVVQGHHIMPGSILPEHLDWKTRAAGLAAIGWYDFVPTTPSPRYHFNIEGAVKFDTGHYQFILSPEVPRECPVFAIADEAYIVGVRRNWEVPELVDITVRHPLGYPVDAAVTLVAWWQV